MSYRMEQLINNQAIATSFFFQAEDGIRDGTVTGVQTCALPISRGKAPLPGIGINPVRPDLVERAGINGVVIAEVRPGTPAAQAGLQALNAKSGKLGDVIVAVNGKRVDTLSTFVAELDRAGIGNTVDLTVLRDDKQRHVKVQVMDLEQ